MPAQQGIAFSRLSSRDIAAEIMERGIVASISSTTIWRWLSEDAIKPWHYRSWIFPRDPDFERKAARVLDLYHSCWEGSPLARDEFVLCADEKTRIQVRSRIHPDAPPGPQRIRRVEHEYERGGYINYLAAWDVHRAKLFGRCEEHTGIAAFDRLVEDVMKQEPYCSAKRVFWIVDNGSSHRGEKSCHRLQSRWPNLILVHLPVHASWLNQIEIYFSVVQRKLLSLNEYASLEELVESILQFQAHYEKRAKPLEWKFARQNLHHLLGRLDLTYHGEIAEVA